jgi:predicted ester cyclase
MSRDVVQGLLARRREAMQRRDLRPFADIYSPSARLESPLAGAVVGPEAIMTATDAFLAAFPDAVISEDEPLIDGDRATVVTDISGTHLGPFLGLPATGRKFRFPAVILITCQDGKIVLERRIYDFTGLLVQIGLLKAKPAG